VAQRRGQIAEQRQPVPQRLPGPAHRRDDPWTERFLAFDEALDRHHPAGLPHHHLAILAVRPGRQRSRAVPRSSGRSAYAVWPAIGYRLGSDPAAGPFSGVRRAKICR
jgi:hypothetical protein